MFVLLGLFDSSGDGADTALQRCHETEHTRNMCHSQCVDKDMCDTYQLQMHIPYRSWLLKAQEMQGGSGHTETEACPWPDM